MEFILYVIVAIIEVIMVKVLLGFTWPVAILLGILFGVVTTFVLSELNVLDWLD